MNRRDSLMALSALGLACAAPLAFSQQSKVYRIGYLAPGSSSSTNPPFLDRLRELGYIEGRNLIVERRHAGGNNDRLKEFAADLVRLKTDLIVAFATPAAQAAQNATTSIPIVFMAVVDPVGAGLVTNLARPEGNATGLSMMSTALSGKRLELLREVIPKLARVAVLGNPDNASNPLQMAEVDAAATKFGVQTQSLEARARGDLEVVFQSAIRSRANALIVLDDPFLASEGASMAALAAKHRLPVMHGFRGSAEAGGLIAYGMNLPDHYRQAATYVDRILKGARPADLPVVQPTKFYLTINMKTARALGIKIPQAVLIRADRVIE